MQFKKKQCNKNLVSSFVLGAASDSLDWENEPQLSQWLESGQHPCYTLEHRLMLPSTFLQNILYIPKPLYPVTWPDMPNPLPMLSLHLRCPWWPVAVLVTHDTHDTLAKGDGQNLRWKGSMSKMRAVLSGMKQHKGAKSWNLFTSNVVQRFQGLMWKNVIPSLLVASLPWTNGSSSMASCSKPKMAAGGWKDCAHTKAPQTPCTWNRNSLEIFQHMLSYHHSESTGHDSSILHVMISITIHITSWSHHQK